MRHKALAALVMSSVVGVVLAGPVLFAQQGKQGAPADGQDYGGERKAEYRQREEAAAPTKFAAERIDTRALPKPASDYVDTLFDTRDDKGGGFFLGKGGKGKQIVRGSREISTATSLKGYGTTPNYLIYEVEDVKSGTGRKIYHGFLKNWKPGYWSWVLVSSNVDNPKDLSSFGPFAKAVRGEKKGNMME
jgi:hypothetical protein